MRILGRFHALRTFVVLAFAVVAILGVVIWLRASHVESKAASEQPAATPYRIVSMEGAQRPSVLFAGDEFTAGYGGIGTNAYPYIVCDSIGLNCNVDAQTGTGFVNVDRVNSPGTVRLIDRLPTDRMIYAPPTSSSSTRGGMTSGRRSTNMAKPCSITCEKLNDHGRRRRSW